MASIRISKAFALVVLSGLSFSSSAFAAGGCSLAEIAAAKALAVKAIALSKTDAGAALAIAKEVALKKKFCFQVAFGSVLDGTGTASLGVGGKKKVKSPEVGGGGGVPAGSAG
jgi:hypothetical protein